MNRIKNFFKDEGGMGVIEVILIIVDNYLSLIPM